MTDEWTIEQRQARIDALDHAVAVVDDNETRQYLMNEHNERLTDLQVLQTVQETEVGVDPIPHEDTTDDTATNTELVSHRQWENIDGQAL